MRAIRSYVGANSGPLTQREHVFYAQREDITTSLRVHIIPGMLDFFDYSPAASGMTYYNNLNLSGVTTDGAPDSVTAGFLSGQWELVTGAQGSLTIAGSVDSDVPGLAPTSYYLDDATAPVTQCTGDAFAYGSSGFWANQFIPNTDPRNPPASFLRGLRTLYLDPPGLTTSDAQKRQVWATTPIGFVTAPLAVARPMGTGFLGRGRKPIYASPAMWLATDLIP